MSPQNRLCLFEGPFGRAVAARLVESGFSVRDLADGDAWRAELAGCGGIILASARAVDARDDELDALAWQHGVPWVSALLQHRQLVVGPLVTPGRGACHACYRRRQRAHARLPERDAVVERALAEAGPDGLRGFTPAQAMVAAELARTELEEGVSGRRRAIDVLTLDFVESEVVRIHGCPRCGRAPDGNRFSEHLEAAWSELMS